MKLSVQYILHKIRLGHSPDILTTAFISNVLNFLVKLSEMSFDSPVLLPVLLVPMSFVTIKIIKKG